MSSSLISAIFRKLPLKWLLVILAVGGVLFASFSDALTLNNGNYPGEFEYQVVNNFRGTRNIKEYYNYTHDGISCLFVSNTSCNFTDGSDIYSMGEYVAYCTDSNDLVLTCTANTTIYYYIFLGDNWLKEWYPDYTSLQCQTEYNLIPIDSVDQEYCTTNNLCPSNGPADCPNVGISNVFINDIFHPGAFNIIINIPEEIDWDYAYTSSGSNLNIDVVGYNQDTEYINGLIDINNYQPTSEDFTNTFLLFKDYGGLLLACLFVILVFYLVKKAFK